MDGAHVTASRTAAATVVATRLLARRDASVVSVIGTGVQARAHARALVRMSGVEVLRVAGRDEKKVKALVEQLSDAGMQAEAAPSIEGGRSRVRRRRRLSRRAAVRELAGSHPWSGPLDPVGRRGREEYQRAW
jgi:ornithine cyclodeaminase/mu-crystallin family protein